jgi:hypothetical protein
MLNPVLPRRAAAFARALGDCTSGLALIEFAFALPVMVTLGLAGMETANYAMAQLKVSNIAVLTADNASRVRDSIDEADVAQLLTGAEMSSADIDFANNGRIILSSVEAAPTGGGQWIRWQRCDGALNVASAYGAPLTAGGQAISNGTEIYKANRVDPSDNPSSYQSSTLTGFNWRGSAITAAPGTAVMIVEVAYDYQPLILGSFLSGTRITYQSAFNVRQRNDQLLHNVGAITPMSCDRFQA